MVLRNIPLEEAREAYLKALINGGLSSKAERIRAVESPGRITAEPVYALKNTPRDNACASDGFAMDARFSFGASMASPVFLAREKYVVVSTGDPLPPGCDAVVMAEEARREESGIILSSAVTPWQHIRQTGEDICAGEMILPSFSAITPAVLGAMLACGVTDVLVTKRPVIGVLPVGLHPIVPGEEPDGGEETAVNASVFSAMLRQWGAEPVVLNAVRNSLGEIRQVIERVVPLYDGLLVCAGASGGSEEPIVQAIAAVGKVLVREVAIKPGKTVALGLYQDKPLFCAPGYPVAGIIALEELFRPVLEFLCHSAACEPEYADAVLSKKVASAVPYREYIRVCLGNVLGRFVAIPLGRGSGLVSSFAKADGILEVPLGMGGYDRGARVPVRLLRPRGELQNHLVAIGSHDPLLDELSELLRQLGQGFAMRSSHVGSMGGLMAVRRGEAHIAGTHLLDEATGGYNIPFIEKFFPNGGVTLVECVRREQGLMLAKGNPKGIRSIRDLSRDGVRLVNRQKGSGTRLLFEYLCGQEGIEPAAIYGFDRIEFTHAAVAARVASGSADAGLGIYAAAQIHGLNFIPICEEEYDLLIPNRAWESQLVQQALEILKSNAFSKRLSRLGGYRLNKPGEVRRRFETL